MAIIKNLTKEQFEHFTYFCQGLFEKPEDITRKDIQVIAVEEDDREVKVTFTVSRDFVRDAGYKASGAFEELKRIEACSKQHGEVGKAKLTM